MMIAPLSYQTIYIYINIDKKISKIHPNKIIYLFTLKTSFAVAEPGFHKYRSKTEFA